MIFKNLVAKSLNIFCISIMIIPYLSVIAQDNLVGTESTYKNGRLRSFDGFEIPFSSLTIAADSLSYIRMNSSYMTTVHKDKVIRAEVQKGSYVLEFGLGCAISGLIGSIIGVEQGESSSGGTVESSKKTNIVVTFTAISTAIGLLIGAHYKKYKTVYTNPRYGFQLDQIPIDLAYRDKSLLIKLHCHF
jgi:hypothetical protein